MAEKLKSGNAEIGLSKLFVRHAEVASGSQSFAGSWVKRLRALCLEPLDQLAPGHRPLPARQFGGRRQVRGSLSFADSYGYSLHRSKSESREQPEEKQKLGKQP